MNDQLSLFPLEPVARESPTSALAASIEARDERCRALEARLPPTLRMGTSSWSFPGWAGIVYPRSVPASVLAREGLREYARRPLLRTVGIDRSYYAAVPPEDLQRYSDQVPDDFVCWFVMRQAPPLPFLAPEWHGKEILALAVCYRGDIAEGERIAKPLREFGRPVADIIGPMPYTAWQTVLDPLLTPGARNYWKSHDFAGLSDGLIQVMMEHTRTIPDPQTEIACAQLGGAVSSVPRSATAYNHRDGKYVMNVHCRWADPAKDEACIAWARGLWKAAAPFATGSVYVNFLTQDEGERVREAYGENFDRLVELKNKYDPSNLFGVNQNIRPTV